MKAPAKKEKKALLQPRRKDIVARLDTSCPPISDADRFNQFIESGVFDNNEFQEYEICCQEGF